MSYETRIGMEIAGYRLESVIGRGGMSVIYLAEQLRLQRKVALKLLPPELALDERFRERFLRESRIASTIEHPNIIQIHDAGEAEGLLYIAMRYVDGPSLKELIRREGALGLGRVMYVLEQIAAALDVAHANGLVHRDIKPANILLQEASDHAFLTDFGIAKATAAHGMTSTGLFLGTIEYCAPEQIEGGAVDARTDIYGLGCVVVECLTGAPPFEHDTEVALMHAHLSTPPPTLTSRRRDLPMALNAVVAQALAKDPDARYQSAGGFAAALREAATRTAFTSGGTAVRLTAAAAAVEPDTAAAPAAEPEPLSIGAAAPPATKPSPRTESAPVRDSGGSARRRSRTSLVIGILGAALVALAAALVVVIITNGNDSSSGPAAAVAATKSTNFTVSLASSAEVPRSIGNPSSGTATITIKDKSVCWSFDLKGVKQPNAAHIHKGGADVTGPVVVPLGGAFTPKGCTAAPATAVAEILADPAGHYVNVHSEAYPDGVVRGQLKGSTAGQGSAAATTTTAAAGKMPGDTTMHMTGSGKGNPAQRLTKLVAREMAWKCSDISPAHRAMKSVSCSTQVPDRLAISVYDSKAMLHEAYLAALRAEHGPQQNIGRCSATSWGGEGEWFHGVGEPGGRDFCYLDAKAGASHLVWTSTVGVPTLYDARYPSLDHRSLYFWWANFRHDLM